MSNISLYELVGDFEKFTDILEQRDVSEDMKEAIRDALSNLCEDIDDRIDDYGKAIKIRQANIKARKEEIDRLQTMNEGDENAIDRMKDIVEKALIIRGKRKLKTAMFNFYFQKNTPSVKFDIPDDQITKLLSKKYLVPVEPKVDKKLLKEDLESGDPELTRMLEGIAHLEQTESIRIR